jgi:drug/metabolite transporter (DMT)-like permease
MTRPPSGVLPGRVMLAFIIVTLIWGSTWLVIRGQLGVVAPAWSICYRFLIAAAAMFVYGAFARSPMRLDRAGIRLVSLIALTQFFLNYALVYHAEARVTSGVVAMIFALLIVPNALLARFFLGMPISRRFALGSIVSLVGLGFLFGHEVVHAASGGGPVALGIAMALVSVLVCGCANVLQASRPGRTLSPVPVMAWSMLIGSAMNALFGLVVAGAPTIDLDPAYLGGIVYLGLFGSAVTFPLYYLVIREMGPARAAYSSVLTPVIAMGLSTLFEGYRWSLAAVFGALLVLIGLLVALSARKPVA